MDISRSYSYATPTTLVMIIADAFECIDVMKAGPLSVTFLDVNAIVQAAWAELVSNVGLEEAMEMVIDDTDIDPEALQLVLESE